MASLKSFLQGVAPILGVSLPTLYERQRALVRLGVLPPSTGAGPGSGVPFTAENFAAILISLLASDSLSDVDQSMVALFKAKPEKTFSWGRFEKRSSDGRPPTDFWSELTPRGRPTFLRDVALVLSGNTAKVPWEEYEPAQSIGDITGVRVSRLWRGQIVGEAGHERSSEVSSFSTSYYSSKNRPARAISITAEIESDMLDRLISFTKDALSQPEGLGQAEEKDDE
jgi:hypothetical protein